MWKINLFLLLTAASFSEATDDDGCSQHSYLACGAHNVPTNFPATGEELNRTCKIEIDFLKCVIGTKENCGADPESIRVQKELLAATQDMCSKDNPNYSVVVNNLACVKPIFDDNSVACYNSYPGHEQGRKYAKALTREGLTPFPEDKAARRDCMKGLYVFTCEALKIEEKCGRIVMEAFINIIHTRTMKFTGSCNPEIKDYLPNIVRIVNFEDFEEGLAEDQ